MMPKRKGHPSGWYQSKEGNTFHVHGTNMTQETIDAVGAMADAARKALEKVCPTCGNKWLHGLEFKDERWHCSCGWVEESKPD